MHLRVRTIIELANLSHEGGLRVAVQFFTGSGLVMPFADECFDVVWTQNTSMKIPDKARLVAEQRRVIQPPASWFQRAGALQREAGFVDRARVSLALAARQR